MKHSHTCPKCRSRRFLGLETLDISRAGDRIGYIDAGAPAAGPGYR